MEEQDIPIEINAGKLLDWLINRRHCNQGWQKNILPIREKINNAIQDMPVHEEIAKLLSGTHINYFYCKKIVEILKETEADTKNLFGRYGSQRMKDWLDIIRLYEKDNLYLAESAQMLMRNIKYEVPSLKRQVQKLEQTAQELDKKELEYKKNENSARIEFQNTCKQLGIDGKKIKRELVEKIKELPSVYDKVSKKTKSLKNVVEFYEAFVEFVAGKIHDCGCVPMIKYVIEKGNTTTYEWTYGEAPLSTIESKLKIDLEDEDDTNDNADIIDFGDIDDNEGIEFGDDNDVDLGEPGDIDWGNIEVEDGENVLQPPDDIDLNNISLEESGIVVEAAGQEGGIASGREALTILDNPVTRNDFIDQLLELESFLKLRLYELKNDNGCNLLSMAQMQEASTILQLSTVDSTQNMLDNVQIVISEMTDNRVEHLHNIKHFPKYVNVLTASLEQKLTLVDKMTQMQKIVREKSDEAVQQSISLRPVVGLVIQKTRELQNDIELDISKKYKNRVVRLTGGVNTL